MKSLTRLWFVLLLALAVQAPILAQQSQPTAPAPPAVVHHTGTHRTTATRPVAPAPAQAAAFPLATITNTSTAAATRSTPLLGVRRSLMGLPRNVGMVRTALANITREHAPTTEGFHDGCNFNTSIPLWVVYGHYRLAKSSGKPSLSRQSPFLRVGLAYPFLCGSILG